MKNSYIHSVLIILFLFVLAEFSFSQQPAANLDQSRNGLYTLPISPIEWQNGNVNSSQAHMVEDYSNPFRIVMTNMPTNGTVITLDIEWDTRVSSKNSYDFITGYDNLEPHYLWINHTTPELVQPLDGYPSLAGLPEVQIPILKPGVSNSSTALQGYWDNFNTRKPGLDYMSLWGGNITGIATPFQYIAEGSVTIAAASTSARITFKSTSSTVILAWGGHIAREQDWGTGQSAGSINGSSYHTRLLSWNLNNLGNQDRSLQADAVIPDFNCDFTLDTLLCVNTADTAFKTLPLSALATYTWSIINVSGANPTPLSGTGGQFIFNSGNSAGSFTVRLVASVPFNNATLTQTCTKNVTVEGSPGCSITAAEDAPYCPGSTQTFTGPADMASYLWSITGNGTIQGAANGQSVTVLAGDTCNAAFHLSLLISTSNGCSSTCNENYLVNDTTPPVITGCPADTIALGCNPTVPTCTDALALITASDNCNGTITPTCQAGDVVTDGCTRIQTFTLSATDSCDNTATCEVTYSWTEDTSAPVFTGCPADTIPLGCNPTVPTCADALALVTVSDICSGSITPTCQAGDVITDGCTRIQTFTLSATDGCDNTATCEVTYSWTEDTTAPVFTGCPTDTIPLGCNPTVPTCTDALALVTVSDICSGSITPTCQAGDVVTDGCTRIQTFTLSATDGCDNTATCEVPYSWTEDTTAPVFTGCPADTIPLGCNPEVPTCTDALALVTVSDLCSGTITPTCQAGDVITDGCTRIQTFTLSATDGCDNTATCEVTYSWTEDTSAPVFTGCPADTIPLGCNPAVPTCADALALVTVSDLCSGSITPTCQAGDIMTVGCGKLQTFTLSATDACDNTATCEVTYSWTENTTPPAFTGCPADTIPLGCNPAVPTCTDALALVNVSDLCSGSVTPTCQAGDVVTNGCTRIQTFTLSATDACDNTATCEVTYSWTEDTTEPVFTGCPADTIPLGCNPAVPTCTDALALVTVSDICSGSITPTCQAGDVITDGCTRIQTFTLSATDGCDNTATCEVTYSWTEDTSVPVFTGCPADTIPLGCNPAVPTCTDALALVTVSDICSGSITPTCQAGDVVTDGCKRIQTFTLSATDACDNTATCEVTYSWTEDTTPPVFTGCPADTIPLGCNPAVPTCTDALALVTVSDICSGSVTPTCQAGDVVTDGCTRIQTFTLSATDACDNTATCEVTYSWTEDTTEPVFTGCPADTIPLGCNPAVPTCTDALALVTVSDICSGSITPTCQAGDVVTDGCIRIQTFTLSATDACDNTATCEVTYSWTEDTSAPVFTGCPADTIPLGCNPTVPTCTDALALVTVSDICSGTITPTCEAGDVVTDDCTRIQTFTLSATDACDNTATCEVTYSWTEDTTPPVFTGCPADTIALGSNPTVPTCTDALALVTVSDLCSGTITPTCQAGDIITDGCDKTQTFTLTAMDACGNDTTCEVIYTWTEDTTPPEFTGCPSDTTDLGCNPETLPTCGEPLGLISANDNCSGPLQPVCSPGTIVQIGNSFYQTFTISATDENGNTSTCYYTYTWQLCTTTFCSYTQGFWGQTNGKACNGLTAPQNLANLLTTPIVLGIPANNRSYTIGAGQVQCVTDVLPASGTPAAFTQNYSCTSILKNTLFGQTLTLALNLRYDNLVMSADFGSFQLPANGVLTVAASQDCNPGGGVTTRTIPANVMTYLSAYYSQTVLGVYNLCNDALGNYWKATVHPSFSDVNVAVSAINEAYDKCGNLITLPALTVTSVIEQSGYDLNVKIVPNPFRNSTNISITSNVNIDEVTVEVYNLTGQKIALLYRGPVSSGTILPVSFEPRPSDQQGMYQLVVKSKAGLTVKKLIYLK